MFQLIIDDNLYSVDFEHYNPKGTDKRIPEQLKKRPEKNGTAGYFGGTVCEIIPLDDKGEIYRGAVIKLGFAYLCRLDSQKYDSERGRKISFTRALDTPEFSKRDRTEFWAKYFETQHHSRMKAHVENIKRMTSEAVGRGKVP